MDQKKAKYDPFVFRKKTYPALFLILLLLAIKSFSAPSEKSHIVDSLKLELSKDLSDSSRIKTFQTLIRQLAPWKPFEALTYAKQALLFSVQIKDDYSKAKILTSIGSIHQMGNEYSKAIAYNFMALRIGEANEFPKAKSLAFNNIGVCYSFMGQFKLAEKYLLESLKVRMKNGMNSDVGVVYCNLGDICIRQGKVKEAIAYCEKAIAMDQKYSTLTSTPFLNIGDAYISLKQLKKAEYYFSYALKLELKNNDTHSLIDCYYALGKLYLEGNDFPKAAQNLFKAKEIAETSGVRIAEADIYDLISKMYMKQKDLTNAYLYKEKYHAAKDSVLNENITRQINEIQAKYDSDKKDKEILMLNQNSEIAEARVRNQNFFSRFLLAAFVFILIISFVLWRNIALKQKVNRILKEKNDELSEKNGLLSEKNLQIETQKQQIEKTNGRLHVFNKELKKENISAQYEILKSKTNPHFLFNSLSTLSAIVADDQKLALEFIDRFSQLYRMILETGDLELISLDEDLIIVKNYLFLQQMKFGNNMEVDIDIPQEYEKYRLPPFALQMVVENAFKHNMISASHKLIISVSVANGMLTVKNNLQQRLSKLPSTETGQKNIIGRYKLLTDILPEFIMTKSDYIVKLPLLKEEKQPKQNKEVWL
jgi:sensor histidine kinase YesM